LLTGIQRARDPEYAALLDASIEKQKGRGRKKATYVGFTSINKAYNCECSDNTTRHRKSEKEEDEELMKENAKEEEDDQPFVFEESPSCEHSAESS
jgi:SWI/SNF-related matrix-associated actin-dependent regulator of chromatin subfamily A member 5